MMDTAQNNDMPLTMLSGHGQYHNSSGFDYKWRGAGHGHSNRVSTFARFAYHVDSFRTKSMSIPLE